MLNIFPRRKTPKPTRSMRLLWAPFHLLLFYHFWQLVTVTLFCGFCFTSPQHIALEYDWPLLSKFYRSSLFGRFPALKAFVRFTNSCVIILAVFGGGFFLLSSSLSGLLTLLLSFNMLLLFPEKRLPFPACFLFFAITCYIATAAHSLVPWSLPCNL